MNLDLTGPQRLCTVAPSSASALIMSNKAVSLGKLEQSLQELEDLVERLEGGELPLEQALKEFERGIKLTRTCQTALKEAEQKVEILLKKTADAAPAPFEADDD